MVDKSIKNIIKIKVVWFKINENEIKWKGITVK